MVKYHNCGEEFELNEDFCGTKRIWGNLGFKVKGNIKEAGEVMIDLMEKRIKNAKNKEVKNNE
ncbi:MAG: hypothetical protein ACFFDN_42685 [Candidatus Hodarchaeota archaeon]